MNKNLIFSTLLSLLTIGSAHAGFGFGFSTGNQCGPNVGFGVSVPLDGDCGPQIGFGFSAPICRPVVYERVNVIRPARVIVHQVQIHRDCEGSKFWNIYNDTDATIVAINNKGKRVSIRPGAFGKLSHAFGFELKVRFAGNDTEYAVVERKGHDLTVRSRGGILVFDDYEFFDDADDVEEIYEIED